MLYFCIDEGCSSGIAGGAWRFDEGVCKIFLWPKASHISCAQAHPSKNARSLSASLRIPADMSVTGWLPLRLHLKYLTCTCSRSCARYSDTSDEPDVREFKCTSALQDTAVSSGFSTDSKLFVTIRAQRFRRKNGPSAI